VAGDYVFLKVRLRDFSLNEPEICQIDFTIGDANTDDVFYLKERDSNIEYAILVRKWTTSPWTISYIKCKHYQYDFEVTYSFLKNNIVNQAYEIDNTGSFLVTTLPAPSFRTFSIVKERSLLQLDVTNTIAAAMTDGLAW
jgi:hypothetical protein